MSKNAQDITKKEAIIMTAVLKKRAMAEYSQTTTETFMKPPPQLKLRLTKTSPIPRSLVALVKLLENTKSSNSALQVLLRMCEVTADENNSHEIQETLKKLSNLFKNESEPSVRAKILAIFYDLIEESNFDQIIVVDEIVKLLKSEHSHKVIAQGLHTVQKLGQQMALLDQNMQQKLLKIAKVYLKDSNQIVKCRCLEMLSNFMPTDYQDDETLKALNLIYDYFHFEDARVRSAAFNSLLALHNRGLVLKYDIYDDMCFALNDDYEIVRKSAIKLVALLGNLYPDRKILKSENEKIKLIDDAFGKICNSITDISLDIRVLAAQLLGTMKSISSEFLHQTLDKKLMSNMRKKSSAHERAKMNLESGEWATGKKWADDAPKEELDAGSVKLISSGSCGAFIHGLEDEFLEVRSATIESICELSIDDSQFAVTALDFLVDMFNDEIEDVRLKAIDSLRRISQHIVIREDQLDIILGALEDFSIEVREGLYKMLASCSLETTTCLKMCIEKILDNLRKYPQDKKSTYRCMQSIGGNHADVTLPLVPELLSVHPFFDTPEPDVEDPLYVCVLILVYNAAKLCSSIINLFPKHTVRHYHYLRDIMPNLVPMLKISQEVQCRPIASSSSNLKVENESHNFLETILKNIDTVGNSSLTNRSLFEAAKEHLSRLVDMDENLAGIAQFTAMFIDCQLNMIQIMEHNMWRNTSTFSSQQLSSFKANLQKVLQSCLELQYCFVNHDVVQISSVKQLYLRGFAMFFIHVVRSTNLSALNLCENFLNLIDDISKMLEPHSLKRDSYTEKIIENMQRVEEPKPGLVARSLLPVIQQNILVEAPVPNFNIRMTKVVINEPSSENDEAFKFTAGLVIGILFDAEIYNLAEPARVRLKIKYPDQQIQIIVPRTSDLKLMDNINKNGGNYRLLTNVSISHNVWTEACYVEINVVLAVPEADLNTCKLLWDTSHCLLDLCKPVKVLIAPKPVKKGI